MSAAASLPAGTCDACLNPGSKPEPGTRGKEGKIGGVDCYIVGSNPNHAVLLATDVFGYQFLNVRQVADVYEAGTGHTVIIPNILHDAMDANQPRDRGAFQTWFQRNPTEEASKIFKAAIADARTQKYKTVIGIGYCYGARMVIDAIKDNVLDAGVVYHPSRLTKEDPASITRPVLFQCAEKDEAFNPELRSAFESALGDGKVKGCKFIQYPNTSHGFGVRPDSELSIKSAKEAHENTINFLKEQVVGK